MKSLLIFACFFLATNAIDKDFVQKIMEKMHKIGMECKEETGASESDLMSLKKHQIPDTHEGKCMIFCFHKKMNMQNEDGSLNREGGIASMQPLKEHEPELYEKLLQGYNKCMDSATVDADPCITGTNFADCAMGEAKNIGLDSSLLE